MFTKSVQLFDPADNIISTLPPFCYPVMFRLISEKPAESHTVEVSVLEVHNNEVFDLLAGDGRNAAGQRRDIITTASGASQVPSLTYEWVEPELRCSFCTSVLYTVSAIALLVLWPWTLFFEAQDQCSSRVMLKEGICTVGPTWNYQLSSSVFSGVIYLISRLHGQEFCSRPRFWLWWAEERSSAHSMLFALN